jgi:CRISPR-associated protein Cmr3
MTAAPSSGWIYSSKQNPCPICGRTKDGDCRISTDGQQVVCHRPKDLRRGHDVMNGWAFTGNTSDGRAGHFTIDKPKNSSGPARVLPFPGARIQATSPSPEPSPITGPIELAWLPKLPPNEPPTHWPDGKRLSYSPSQWVIVKRDASGAKAHKPWHIDANGQEVNRQGDAPWPLWRESDALEHGRGLWIAEAEGEKCAAWLMVGGLVAVSQPGHAHKVEQIAERYQRLVDAGVKGIIYLEDNDEEGRRRSRQSRDAAAAVELPLLVLPAAEVWPGLPEKGSIDDAPGTAAERVADLEAAIPKALQRRQQPRQIAGELLTPAEVRECLAQEITDGIGAAGLAELVVELTAASGLGHPAVRNLADAIRAEQHQAAGVEAEAAALAAEKDRKEIGQLLTPSYLLPPSLAQAIEVRTRYLPVDGPSAVLPFLAAVAGLVKLGTEVEAIAAADYRVPVNLFACLVGRSGAKKTPVLKKLVEAPTERLQADLARANQQAHSDWEETCRGMSKGESPPAPLPKRLRCSDFTGEALTQQLQTQEAHGLGLLIYRDELSGLFGSLNQYKGGKGSDEQQLLELFDGSGLSSLRINGDRHYSRSQVSIFGGTQPTVLKELVAKGDASGLWARFLFVPLPARPVPLTLSTTPEEVALVEAAAQTLADTCQMIYRMPRRTYRLSADAAARFATYELSRQHAALATNIGAQSALYGKSAGKVLRVAGVLHLLQIAAGEADSQDQIKADAVDRAAALVDHLDAWALSLHAEVAAGGVCDLMRNVHRRSAQLRQEVSWKDVRNGLSKQQREQTNPAAVAAAMRALAAQGYGEVSEGPRSAVLYRATGELP